ncbi:MAG: hypothetical protein IJN27_07145 [Oscillospiraceae bacterium]|nr:hypothetical protein [Oscillospiraceae bacterium]
MSLLTLTRGSVVFAVAFIAVVFASTAMLAGCSGDKNENNIKALPAGTMLIDCYRTEKAADDSGYFELVLYTTENSDMIRLSVYSKDNKDTDENHTDYLVPYEAAESCYKIIEKHHLNRWNDMKNTVSADGILKVCKYYSNGEYVRVSTEEMPQNGTEILDSIADVMSSYAKDKFLIEIQDTEVG